MKRLLLVLILLATAMAVEIDEDTGCEKYSDHVVCPQSTDIEAWITYSGDAECFSVQNEFGNLEELGCYAEATLANTLEYESCKMRVPFDTDIRLDLVDYEYQCTTERLEAGDEVYVMGFREDFGECATVEEDEYYGEYLCAVAGRKHSITGAIQYDDGTYGVLLYSQEAQGLPFADVSTALIVLAIAVLLVYTLYVWSENKK